MVANDLGERSVVDLVSSQSPRAQMAPPGFWIVEKALSVISYTPAGLRFFPLVGGVVLVLMALLYAGRHLHGRPAKTVLVSTVSLSPALIHYSAEVKPYGIEAAVSMLLMLAAMRRHQWGPTRLTLVGVGAIFFSLPALVMVPLLASAFSVELARTAGLNLAISRLWKPASVLAFAEAITIYAVSAIRPPIDDFWEQADAFAPFPVSSAGIIWLARTAARTARFAFFNVGIIGRPLDDSLDNAVWVATALLIVALFAGAVITAVLCWRRERHDGLSDRLRSFMAAVVPSVAILAAMVMLAGLNTYPMHGRLTVYLFPLVFLIVAHSIELVWDRRFGQTTVVAAIVLSLIALPRAVEVAVTPYDRFDVIEALEWIEGKPQPGDVIVFDQASSGEAFAFHSGDFDFGATDIRYYNKLDAEGIAPLADGHTVWFFSAFVTSHNSGWVDELLLSELVVDSWSGDGVVVAEIEPS